MTIDSKQQPSKLFYELTQRPIPPDHDFGQFVVGERITNARATIVEKIESISDRSGPSQALVVIGDNGNGKTLLNNMIKEYLSVKNEAKETGKEAVGARFESFFSHITSHGGNPANIGLKLFQGLQFHREWDSNQTYALISLRVFNDFSKSYKLPLSVKLLQPVKWIVKGGITNLDKLLGGFFSDVLGETTGEVFNKANVQFQRHLARRHILKEFHQYCSRRKIGGFLVKQYKERHEYLSPNQLNDQLFADMENSRLLDSAYDAVKELCEIVGSVQGKVVVIMIDDCNDRNLLNGLMRLIDGLGDFDSEEVGGGPRLLLVPSMLEGAYSEIMEESGYDRSLRQRLAFNPPLKLLSPSQEEITILIDRLVMMFNMGVTNPENSLRVDVETKERLVEQCKERPYRESISYIAEKFRELLHRPV